MKSPLTKEEIEQLVETFAEAVAVYAASLYAGRPKDANRQAKNVMKTFDRLKADGLDAQMSLLRLLDHSDPNVQAVTAGLVIQFAPERSVPVLERFAQEQSIRGVSCSVALAKWRGELGQTSA